MIKKIEFPTPKNFDLLETIQIEENNSFSKFFNVSRLNNIYGLGYHSVLIRGSKYLKKFSSINYEMYDLYGKQIQCRIRGNNLIVGSTNTILSFLIEPEHYNGAATFILVGKTTDYNNVENYYDTKWKFEFIIDNQKQNDDDLIFNSGPDFSFEETANGIVNEIGQEVTIANITASSLYPFSGKLETVALYTRISDNNNDFSLATMYKLNSENESDGTIYDNDLSQYIQYSTASQITNEINYNTVSFQLPLVVLNKPTYYDMKMIFYDGKDELCRNEKGEIVSVVYKNVPFNGIGAGGSLKYDNVIGVTNVEWANSNLSGSESGILQTGNSTIEITWDDLKYFASSRFDIDSHDIYGVKRLITYNMARNIQKYAVWMFITNDQDYELEWLFPGRIALFNSNLFNQSLFNEKSFPTPDNKGEWYFKGFFATNYASIDVPKGYAYSFWVGFINQKTIIPALTYYTAQEEVNLN